MNRIRVGNIEWNLVDKGNGPVVLFVHGFPLTHQMWRYQVEELSKKFRVLCPDMPSYGETIYLNSVPETSMKQMADELVALLNALEISEVAFCGLSMGGYVGWQFWKHHSERLSHMIACDTRAVADTEEIARGRRMIAHGVLKNGVLRVAEAMIPKLFSLSTRRNQKPLVKEVEQVISSATADTIALGHLAMAAREDMSQQLMGLDPKPCLLIAGADDEISTPAEMQELARQIPNARFFCVPEAGHLAPLEQPETVNAEISSFLR